MWAVFFLTLPTQPNAVRLRVWRALKTLGCGALHDGAYLLPREHANLFQPLMEEVRENGGHAMVLDLSTRDEAQRAGLVALFDRRAAYAQWRMDTEVLMGRLRTLGEVEARRRVRAAAEALQALRRIDYYPDVAAEQAQAHLVSLRQALDARFARRELGAGAGHEAPGLHLPR